MVKVKWLVINYNLPTEPSRHRVATWRALKKLGAANIQQSMWILPWNEGNCSALQKISSDIEANNGEALLMESVFFNEIYENRVVSIFNAIRDEEYTEFISECKKYLKELEKEIFIKKFTFAELDEEEQEHDKLINWYEKISIRDMFNAPQKKAAEESLSEIKKAFEDYSSLVYEAEGR